MHAKDAVLTWARQCWPDATILHLNDLIQMVQDPALKKQLLRLSKALYHNEGSSLWQGDELLKAVHCLKVKDRKKIKKNNVLPPINRL